MATDLADTLARLVRIAGLPEPVREYRFHPVRKWRFDLCWPDRLIAAEADGGVWSGGRHTRGAGFSKDCEKTNEAAALGWRVLRFTADMLRDGRALAVLDRVLREEG